ncbi:MAG: hypothetical protein JF619_30605, partial [Massilia sp.]|nr:hypothetical protein [Massilia sp.]
QVDVGFDEQRTSPQELAAVQRAPAASTAAAKCPECGARALRKVDGCLRCDECHHMGGCG